MEKYKEESGRIQKIKHKGSINNPFMFRKLKINLIKLEILLTEDKSLLLLKTNNSLKIIRSLKTLTRLQMNIKTEFKIMISLILIILRHIINLMTEKRKII